MPPSTIPRIIVKGDAPPLRRHYSTLQVISISPVPAHTVPIELRFNITKNRKLTREGDMETAVFSLRCKPCNPNIPSFWERLDDHLV